MDLESQRDPNAGAQRGPNKPQSTRESALGLDQKAGVLTSRTTVQPMIGLGNMYCHPHDASVSVEF